MASKTKLEPSTEKGNKRREQILRVALQLFASQGIEGTGLRQIAHQAGIAQPALYHYFTSKDALVDGVIEWRAAENAKLFPNETVGSTTTQTLREGLLAYLENIHSHSADPDNIAIHQIMLAEFARQSHIANRLFILFVEPQMKRLENLFARLTTAGKIRDLDPAFLALQFIGPLMTAAFISHRPGSTFHSPHNLLFQHLEVFIRGIER